MNKYHVWFNDEGENKGSKIESQSDIDAASIYLARYSDDVLTSTSSIYVRYSCRAVREIDLTSVRTYIATSNRA